MQAIAHRKIDAAELERVSAWHQTPEADVLRKLSSRLSGLTETEAIERLRTYGRNELRESKPISPWFIFAQQFKSLLILLLVIAAAVSFAISDWIDSIVILAIVFLNAGIGFYQEFSAEKSIAALKRMTAPHATVRRGGKPMLVPASQVVPGDILLLDSGDLVAADARVLEANSLQCVESALTGESEPVQKRRVDLEGEDLPLGDRENMLFL